jgi:hypothetical protein
MAIFLSKSPVENPKMWGLMYPEKSKKQFLEHSMTLGQCEVPNLVRFLFWFFVCFVFVLLVLFFEASQQIKKYKNKSQ